MATQYHYVRSKLLSITYKPFITWPLLTHPASPPNTLPTPSSITLDFTASQHNPEYVLLIHSSPHTMLLYPSPSGTILPVLPSSTLHINHQLHFLFLSSDRPVHSGVTRPKDMTVFRVFNAYCQIASQKVCKNFHTHHHCIRMSISLHSWYQMFLSAVLMKLI